MSDDRPFGVVATVELSANQHLLVAVEYGFQPRVRLGSALLMPAAARDLGDALRLAADLADNRELLRDARPKGSR